MTLVAYSSLMKGIVGVEIFKTSLNELGKRQLNIIISKSYSLRSQSFSKRRNNKNQKE